MAIVKFNNRKNSTDSCGINQLRRSINYICDSKKTRTDLIGGVGVNASNALQRMEIVKNFYGKTNGREYIHFCVSFSGKPNEKTVFEIATEIAKYYGSFQVLYAVHLNTHNTHIHFIINTVCVIDGHKFSQSKSELEQLKDYIDNVVCRYNDLYYSIEESEDIVDDDYDYCLDDDYIIDDDFVYSDDDDYECIPYDMYDDDAAEIYCLTNDVNDNESITLDFHDEYDFYFEESEEDVLLLQAIDDEHVLIEPMIFFSPSEKVLPSIINPYANVNDKESTALHFYVEDDLIEPMIFFSPSEKVLPSIINPHALDEIHAP